MVVQWRGYGSVVAGNGGQWGLAKKKAASLVAALFGGRKAAATDGELRKRSGGRGICRCHGLGF